MPLIAGAEIFHRLEDRRDAAEAVGDGEEIGEMKTADHREMSGRRPQSHIAKQSGRNFALRHMAYGIWHKITSQNSCFDVYCARSSKSSMLGNSDRSLSPNWIRNSFDVPYIIGRPTVSFLPLVTISRFSSSVLTAEEDVTPRISRISGIVIGCL